ncbi:MAG: serine hydrolase, partial [Bryobacteraceae bacterium]
MKGFDGRVGVCAQDGVRSACFQGDDRYSLQSVMKLIVGMAVMDAVDHRGWKLDERVTIRKADLSLYVQPIAKLVTGTGYTTTVGDLVRRAIVDSDSAAVDILIRRLGGPQQVQAFLDRNGVKGVRIDRQERDLQTEIAGLTWKPEYVDPAALERDRKAVPEARREAANHKYQTDPRDTATPHGMAGMLLALAESKLLSPESSRHLVRIMTETVTFPDRLKAGTPPGWTIAHKTGTSGAWNGMTIA